MRLNQAILGLGVLVGGCAAGCQIVIDVGDWVVVETDATSTGGAAGSGGSGGAPACMPGEIQSCYDGPPDTAEVGACRAGVQTCMKEGTGFGLCEKQALPTPELCASPADENCDGYDCGIWSAIFGDGSAQEVQDVDVDADGNIIVVGRFSGSMSFGGDQLKSMAGNDLFVAKFDAGGKHLWSKQYGDSADLSHVRAAVDGAGNIFLAGTFAGSIPLNSKTLYASQGSIFTIKLKPEGGPAWGRTWTGDVVFGVDVVVTPAGAPVLVGRFYTSVKFVHVLTAAGAGTVFVAKLLGSNGDPEWDASYEEAIEIEGNGLGVDSAGNVYVAGGVGPFSSIPKVPECVSGTYVAKFTPTGMSEWTTCLLAVAGATPSIALDPDQNIFVGSGNGTSLSKLDPGGGLVWHKQFVTADSEYPSLRVALTKSGEVVLALAADGKPDLGGGPLQGSGLNDVFVARYKNDGSYLWAKVYGNAASQRGPFVAACPDETVALGCTIDGNIDFGMGKLQSLGADIAIAKLGR